MHPVVTLTKRSSHLARIVLRGTESEVRESYALLFTPDSNSAQDSTVPQVKNLILSDLCDVVYRWKN